MNAPAEPRPRACLLSAVHSGSGKTTVSLGIIRALARRGLTVQPFKAGPDFLDGTFHTRAAGTSSYNLDTWMIDTEALSAHFRALMTKRNIGIVEGAMGLYDGFEGTMKGSSAELARTLGIPVVLVIDCKGLSGSVAPLVHGFRTFRSDVHVSGVILNRTAGDRHFRFLKEALSPLDIKIIGHLPRNESYALEHRHLGLVAASYGGITEELIETIAEAMKETIDLDLLVRICAPVAPDAAFVKPIANKQDSVCRIAVARDAAFHFYYQANLDMLEAAGAELVEFSPLSDRSLPDSVDGLIFGGGYPEEHAAELAENELMRRSILDFSLSGGCIYAECGGYMYLGGHIEKDGIAHPMCGVFPSVFKMNDGTLKNIGYRKITLAVDTILGPAGTVMHGHEFHYSVQKTDREGTTCAPFRILPRIVTDIAQPAGLMVRNTLGSYLHVHFLSNPAIVKHIVTSCCLTKKAL